MGRLITVGVVLILALTGCKPDGSGGGGGKPPPPPPPGAGGLPGTPTGEYVIDLDALDEAGNQISRVFECIVTGLAAGKIVELEDEQTGAKAKYVLPIKDRTPIAVRIKDYAKVHLLEVICIMIGQPGESFFMEALMPDRLHPAPVVEATEHDEIPDGQRRALTKVLINTLA